MAGGGVKEGYGWGGRLFGPSILASAARHLTHLSKEESNLKICVIKDYGDHKSICIYINMYCINICIFIFTHIHTHIRHDYYKYLTFGKS